MGLQAALSHHTGNRAIARFPALRRARVLHGPRCMDPPAPHTSESGDSELIEQRSYVRPHGRTRTTTTMRASKSSCKPYPPVADAEPPLVHSPRVGAGQSTDHERSSERPERGRRRLPRPPPALRRLPARHPPARRRRYAAHPSRPRAAGARPRRRILVWWDARAGTPGQEKQERPAVCGPSHDASVFLNGAYVTGPFLLHEMVTSPTPGIVIVQPWAADPGAASFGVCVCLSFCPRSAS
jgi:hypothetical protein